MLGSKGIEKALSKGEIEILPFFPRQLNPNSYDITLGNWFALPNVYNSPINLDLEESVYYVWQDPIFVSSENTLVLEPGMCILTHTQEFIGSRKHAMLLKARSTFGRLFIDVCPSAGFGDIGYVNRWTLEIKNNSDNHYILKPHMRVGQISFLEIKGIGITYSGAYVQREYIHNWKPEDMLPKLGTDRVF